MRLTERVFLVGGGNYGLSHVTDCNLYLINGDSELAVIDAGSGFDTAALLDNIRAEGLDPDLLSHVLLTHSHWDHARGAAALQDTLGARIAVHESGKFELEQEVWRDTIPGTAGYPGTPCGVDLALGGGEQIRVGDVSIAALAVPGHSDCSMAYTFDDDGVRVLFTGDTVQGGGRIGVTTGPERYDEFRASLVAMKDAAPTALFPGHHVFTLDHAGTCIEFALEHLHQEMKAFDGPPLVPMNPRWWLLTHADIAAPGSPPDEG